MSRISATARMPHDRNGREGVAVRAILGALLILLTAGAAAMHGHGGATDAEGASPVFAASDGAPGPLHGHTQTDALDCQFCELSRRGELEEASPASTPPFTIQDLRSAVRIADLVSAPRAPTRGRPSPRAPPVLSV